MNHSALIRHFQEILRNASDQDLLGIMQPAKEGIDCERCNSLSGIIFIDLGREALFLCPECITKYKHEEPEVKTTSSRGLTLRFKVLIRDKFRCVYCGRNPREDGVKLEVDHIYPKSKGGSDSMTNLATACWECNQGKKDLIIEEN